MQTLRELSALIPQIVREAFNLEKEEGCTCPLCGQMAKVYKRKITSDSARKLITLHLLTKSTDRTYHHISTFSDNGSSDFAKLRYFGLVEEAPNSDETKRTSGLWSITDKGKLFVKCFDTVPKHVILYNGELQGFTGDEIDIRVALGQKFNYSELMGNG